MCLIRKLIVLFEPILIDLFKLICKAKWTWKWKWHVAKYGNPYSELVLCIYPIQVHTHSSEHTPGAVGSHFMLRRPGSSWGFCALLKSLTSVVVLKVEESAVHSLPPPTIPAGPETRTHNLWVTSPTL